MAMNFTYMSIYGAVHRGVDTAQLYLNQSFQFITKSTSLFRLNKSKTENTDSPLTQIKISEFCPAPKSIVSW